MAVFVEDAAFHGGHEFAVGEGPVGDGEAGVAAGYEASRDDEEEGAEGEQDRPAMQAAVIGWRVNCHR